MAHKKKAHSKKMSAEHMKEYEHMGAKKLAHHMHEEKELMKSKKAHHKKAARGK